MKLNFKNVHTGKSFSEALILASTKIVHGIAMKTTSAEHGQNMGRTYSALVVFMVIP